MFQYLGGGSFNLTDKLQDGDTIDLYYQADQTG